MQIGNFKYYNLRSNKELRHDREVLTCALAVRLGRLFVLILARPFLQTLCFQREKEAGSLRFGSCSSRIVPLASCRA